MNKLYSTSSALKFKKVTHVLFDLDGLLLDTEVTYKRVFSEIAQKHGKVYTPEIRAKVVGTVDTESARIAVTEMKLPMSPDQFLAQFKAMARQSFVKNIPILPGAERLIRHLHSTNVPIAVATSSAQESFNVKVKNYQELFSLFNHIVTGGSDPDVKQGKPAPDIFLVCASRFQDKPKPEECLVFEDSPNGVTAGISAGMQVVMVPDAEMEEKQCQHATLKLNSLVDLKPELFGLPKFPN